MQINIFCPNCKINHVRDLRFNRTTELVEYTLNCPACEHHYFARYRPSENESHKERAGIQQSIINDLLKIAYNKFKSTV